MADAVEQPLVTGFDDAPRQSQRAFRAVMDALARPGAVQPLLPSLCPPSPLTPELAAIVLALADHDASIWLDDTLSARPAVAAYLRFHTGAPIVTDPKEAAFALVSDPDTLPPLNTFALGTDEYPDRSTTILIAVRGFDAASGLLVEGPGMERPHVIAPSPMPSGFRARVIDNNALFPRGVDLVFAAPGAIVALPRSSRVSGEA